MQSHADDTTEVAAPGVDTPSLAAAFLRAHLPSDEYRKPLCGSGSFGSSSLRRSSKSINLSRLGLEAGLGKTNSSEFVENLLRSKNGSDFVENMLKSDPCTPEKRMPSENAPELTNPAPKMGSAVCSEDFKNDPLYEYLKKSFSRTSSSEFLAKLFKSKNGSGDVNLLESAGPPTPKKLSDGNIAAPLGHICFSEIFYEYLKDHFSRIAAAIGGEAERID